MKMAVLKERYDYGSRERRKERGLGEMISSVSFYGLGIYAILNALTFREGAPLLKCIAIALAGLTCVAARHVLSSPIW